jgi:alpha-galactosidase
MTGAPGLFRSIADGAVVPFAFRVAGRPAALRPLWTRVDAGDGSIDLAWDVADAPITAYAACVLDEPHGLLTWRWRLLARDNTPRVSCVRPLSLTWPHDRDEAPWTLRGITGGRLPSKREDGSRFPPDALRPWQRELEVNEPFELDSDGCGKSSSSHVPIWLYFGPAGGLWFGPEWSGSWRFEACRAPTYTRLDVWLDPLDFVMLQGEEIELPGASLARWSGSMRDGHNHLRRTLRDCFLPRIDGQVPLPLVTVQGLGGQETYHTEEGIRREADAAARLGAEQYTFNAGWYQSPDHESLYGSRGKPMPWGEDRPEVWFETMGDFEPHPERFPSGVEAFVEYLRERGMSFGLWIDTRVAPGAACHDRLAHVLLAPDPSRLGPGRAFPSVDFFGTGLVDLARRAGRDWLEELLERLITRYGASWVWIDMNTFPRPLYWDCHEAPDRRGLMELRFYQGFGEVVDRVLARHPDVRVETCGNGGMYIDLAMLRRSHSVWIDDYVGFEALGQPYDIDVNRSFRTGICQWLPGALPQSSLYIPWAVTRSDEPYDPIHYASHFAGTLTFGQRVQKWKPADLDLAARAVSVYKEIRPYTLGDFYPLFPLPDSRDAWEGWQFHDPDAGEGALIVFRLPDSTEPGCRLGLGGETPPDRYAYELLLGQAELTPGPKTLACHVPDEVRFAVIRYRRR